MDEAKMIVVKRDGKSEPYDENKLIKICESLGLSEIQEDNLVRNVTNKVKAYNGDVIPTYLIHDYVYDELTKISDYFAEQFDWYYKMNKAEGK